VTLPEATNRRVGAVNLGELDAIRIVAVIQRAAEEAAKSVPGVRIVHNFILVTMEGVPQPDVAEFIQAETVGDEALTARINLLLLAQAVLQAERIDVLVEEGVATLDGSVNAFWKRNRAEELALSVDGVREVVNKLTIVPNGGAGDEEIAARIFDGLERNFLIDAQTVDVKVNDALVTLRGTVPSRLAKQEAFQIALGTEGVVDVRDELVIAAA